MDELTIITQNGGHYIDSREVAELCGKTHERFMRDIADYIKALKKSVAIQMEMKEYFIESNYTNYIDDELPYYLLTKKGCEVVANRLTGKKGILFTAAYIGALTKMETQLKMAMTVPKYSQAHEHRIAEWIIRGILEAAAIPQEQIDATLQCLCDSGENTAYPDGETEKQSYQISEIASLCGIMSLNDKPHPRAATAIINILNIGEEHQIPAFTENNTYYIGYDEYVLDAVRFWLEDHEYPTEITYGDMTYKVHYNFQVGRDYI